jgi:hypothetical protein
MNRSVIRLAAAISLMSGASMLLGCEADGGRLRSYRLDPTPNLDRLGQELAVEENYRAITQETNLRAMNDDLSRAFFTDRPTRLTPRRMPW